MRSRAVLAIVLVLSFTASVSGYWLLGGRWGQGSNIVMHLQLGGSGRLLDGSADWNAAAEAALAIWNPYLNGVSFRVVRDSTAPIAFGNDINNVFWDDNVYGLPFPDAVAVAPFLYSVSDGNTFSESDVIFNTRYSWNSYRGQLQEASTGGWLYDVRRVALHEFGHTLGLDHPDDHGQRVRAVMNSGGDLDDVDTVQTDDINGARAIYGSATPPPPQVRDTLTSGARLLSGQSLISNNARFRLLYQSDGNLVLYDGNTSVWTSNTIGRSAGQAIMQADGNFIIYDAQGIGLWTTATSGNPGAYLVVQGDGNLVVYRSNGQPLWDRIRCAAGC